MSLRMARMVVLPSCLALLLVGLSTSVTREVSAASPSSSRRAHALFDAGRELAKAGRYAEACPKFIESYKLEIGMGTEFNLADCWEHLGQRELARTLFIDVAQQSREAGQLERAALAKERAAALLSPPPEAPPVSNTPEAPRVEIVAPVIIQAPAPAPEQPPARIEPKEAVLPVRLRDEYAALADASAQLQELRKSAAELARSPQNAERVRVLSQELTTAQLELDEAMRVAGRLAALALRQADWSRRSAVTKLKAAQRRAKPRVAAELASTAR